MQENTSLFGLSVDSVTKEHLSEIAKWARFLAIVGFVFLVFMVISGLIASATLSRLSELDGFGNAGRRGMGGFLGTFTAILYVIFGVVLFFPLFFLLKFANAMRTALGSNDQERLNASFQNLKAYFRYLGIVTIIILVFFLLGIVMSLAGLAVNS